MTVPISNPQPDSYGDSVPYQGSMPYQSGGLYPGDGFYQGGVPYQGGGFYQGSVQQSAAVAAQPAVPTQPAQVVPQAGVPAQSAYQGVAPGYAPVPQGPVVQKVNRLSIILGIVGWVLVGLTVLGTWLAIRASASDPDPSGKEVIGFLPLFALMFIGPVNLAGGIFGIVGAVGKPKTLKLNWLGILLNASPYVIFAVL